MRTRSGWTMVSTLATVAIMAILMVALFKGSSMFGSKGSGSSRADGKGTTIMGAAEYAARDEVCRSNLGQIRAALQIAESSDSDGKFPQNIAETHLGSDYYKCPLGHEPYAYDPASGQVHCVHPGHEKY